MTSDVLIIDAVRSPIGGAHGRLAALDSVALLAQVFTGLLARSDVDPADIDDVIVGEDEFQPGGVGRRAWSASGLPLVPTASIGRHSGSSQRALRFAAQGIRAGAYHLVVVAGVSTPAPGAIDNSLPRADSFPSSTPARVSVLRPAADAAVAHLGLSRADLDRYASRSHHRAAASTLGGDFAAEIVPVEIPTGDPRGRVTADDSIRPTTTAEALAALEPIFGTPTGSSAREGQPPSITAGNSAHPSSGASAILIASRRRAKSLWLRPRARVIAISTVRHRSPHLPAGPISATEKILASGKVRLNSLDHVEVDELFAGLPLAWANRFRFHPDLMNPRGGSISLGDPVGAASCRLLTTTLNALETTGGRFGLQTMYETVDIASAVAIERL